MIVTKLDILLKARISLVRLGYPRPFILKRGLLQLNACGCYGVPAGRLKMRKSVLPSLLSKGDTYKIVRMSKIFSREIYILCQQVTSIIIRLLNMASVLKYNQSLLLSEIIWMYVQRCNNNGAETLSLSQVVNKEAITELLPCLYLLLFQLKNWNRPYLKIWTWNAEVVIIYCKNIFIMVRQQPKTLSLLQRVVDNQASSEMFLLSLPQFLLSNLSLFLSENFLRRGNFG